VEAWLVEVNSPEAGVFSKLKLKKWTNIKNICSDGSGFQPPLEIDL
jgi:hypothetical protein